MAIGSNNINQTDPAFLGKADMNPLEVQKMGIEYMGNQLQKLKTQVAGNDKSNMEALGVFDDDKLADQWSKELIDKHLDLQKKWTDIYRANPGINIIAPNLSKPDMVEKAYAFNQEFNNDAAGYLNLTKQHEVLNKQYQSSIKAFREKSDWMDLEGTKKNIDTFKGRSISDSMNILTDEKGMNGDVIARNPEKPFNVGKDDKINEYGNDPNDNNQQIVTKDKITEKAVSNYKTPSGKKHYDETYDALPPEKKKQFEETAKSLGIDNPVLAYAIKSTSDANPPRSKQTTEQVNIAEGHLFDAQNRTAILGEKQTGVTVTKNNNGTYNNVKGNDLEITNQGGFVSVISKASVPAISFRDEQGALVTGKVTEYDDATVTVQVKEGGKYPVNATVTLPRKKVKFTTPIYDKGKKTGDKEDWLDNDKQLKDFGGEAFKKMEEGRKGTAPAAGGNKGTSGKTPTPSLNQ